MTDSIVSTTTELVNKALAEGKIIIDYAYDPETESLNNIASGGIENE